MDPLQSELLERLPHQRTMRLVEELVEVIPGSFARTHRRTVAHDWFFDGHFPTEPVVPSIVLVELVAQTGGLAACSGEMSGAPIAMRVAALANFKFPAAATPGVLLETTARVAGRYDGLTKIDGQVTADGRLVAVGSVTLAVVERVTGT